MKDISQLIQERNELLKSHIAGQFIKADKLDGHWVTSEETGKHIFIGSDGKANYTREQIEGSSGSLGGVADEPSDDSKFKVKTSQGEHDLRWDKNNDKHKDKFSKLNANDHNILAAAHSSLKTPVQKEHIHHQIMADWHNNQAKEETKKDVERNKNFTDSERKLHNLKLTKDGDKEYNDKIIKEARDKGDESTAVHYERKQKENSENFDKKIAETEAKIKEEKMDKYSKELSNRISEGKLTETEGMFIKTAFKREKPVDPDKIIETANKIAKHDKSDNRKIEHVAEALFFEMERDHPHFGRAELSDFEGESKTAREAAFHRLERMNELGLLHEEGKKDISLLKEYDKKVKQLDPVSRTLLNSYLSKTVFSNVDKEDGLGRDAMEHAISILNDTLNDKNPNKDQQVSVLANHLSNRLEKEKEGNIKNAKPINKDIKITNVAPLEKIVKESKTVKEAFDKIRQVKNVSSETARQFREKYDPENNLTMMDSFERFYNDVKGK